MGLINTLIEIALFNFDLAGGETLILHPPLQFFQGRRLLVDFKNLNPSRRDMEEERRIDCTTTPARP